MRLLPALAALAALLGLSGLTACLPPDGPGEAETPPGYGRELGTLIAIYPEPRPDGGYDLELRLTRDTILADYGEVRAYASDSVGRSVFRSARETFYTRDGRCFFSPRKETCLPFRPAAD